MTTATATAQVAVEVAAEASGKKKSSDKTEQILQGIMDLFQSGEVGPYVALAANPLRVYGAPSEKWSFLNRLIMILEGKTQDARGFKQWQAVGRKVKKGSKAFYILGPLLVPKKKKKGEEGGTTPEKTDKGEKKDEKVLIGFRGIPVFRVEDTEGDPLPEPPEVPSLPEFPLLEVAEAAGIHVSSTWGNGAVLGWYSPGTGGITMASPEAMVFFHELGHALHHLVCPKDYSERGKALKEVVAELSAVAMAVMVGFEPSKITGQAWVYIQRYGGIKACMQVLKEVGTVLDFVNEHRTQ